MLTPPLHVRSIKWVEHFQALGARKAVAIPDEVIAVEHLIVDIDCHEEFLIVEPQITRVVERLFALGACVIVHEPIIDAVHVEDVVAGEDATLRTVRDWLQADHTLSLIHI